MKKFKILWVFVLLLCAGSLKAQVYTLPPEPENFGNEVAKILNSAGNHSARINGELFKTAWTGGKFTATQQKEIIKLSQAMLVKRFKPVPQLANFFGALALAADRGLPSNEMDNLLSVTAKVLEKQETKQINQFLSTLETFFGKHALYLSNYSSLFADGGTISFEYKESEPMPAAENAGGWGEIAPAEEEEEDHFSDWDVPAQESESDWSNDWSSWESPAKAEGPQTPEETATPLPVEPLLPALEGAIIRFDNVNLSFVSNNDSIILYNTSGSFMPVKEIFVGEGGKIDWSNAGLNPNEVYVQFGKYSFITSKPELSAENVMLTYNGKISAPVAGVFEYKNSRYNKPEEAQYPRFKSYESNINVNNLGDGQLKYNGGFSLRGSQVFSSSVYSGVASIEATGVDNHKFVIKSKQFNLQDSLIEASISAVVISHGQDSIYHPAVRSRFNTQTKVLTILKDVGSFKGTPFISSHFKMDISADVIRWNIGADSLHISILSGKNQVAALFESQEYFNIDRYSQLSALYGYHPLLMAVGYARKKNSGQFYVEDMARDLKQEVKTLRGAMKHLMQNGYVDYDVSTDFLKINRKGYHYVLSSNQRKDFDDLLIPSLEPSLPNATFFLTKQELKVRGIDKFFISRSKDVFIHPENDEITLLKNRDFVFDGEVHAGNFIFMGTQMRFNYDSFLIDLPTIDSIKFDVEDFKDPKQLKRQRLDNQLVETSGVLKIDLPNNKSSRQDFPDYPVFNAFSGSTVHFDGQGIAGGNYSENVSFTIPPFEIDSLSSSDPAAITFQGTFSSGGIVPDFKETLKILEDKSLGFTHLVPKNGYKLYDGAATLYDTLIMDGNGLHSSGHIDYLSTVLYSKNFIFFEDSVVTEGTKVEMKQGAVSGANFPVAGVGAYEMNWYPKKDSMYLQNIKDPFNLFGEVASLDGNLVVNSKGLRGSGKLHTNGADVESSAYRFNQRDFIAENASFIIQSSNAKKPILAANDVYITYDLDKGIAGISPEVEGIAALDFPYAQVKTSIPKASWNFEEKTVSMTKPRDFDLSKSYFYTTRKELDSLVFNAEDALYNIENQTLKISGVPYIKVADAKITPENNEVVFFENARIQDFMSASIVMDTINEYHHLDNGKIKIQSRNKFLGSATYKLVNASNDTFPIEFNSFELLENGESRRKKALRTVSSGTVKAEDLLMISPGMVYRGNVTMYADKPALELNGFVKLDLKNIPDYDTWINYQSTADQREIAFNFESSVTEDGQPLVAGIYYDSNTSELYPAFVTQKRAETDQSLFVPAGKLTYDAVNNEYRIEEESKKEGKSYAGRIFAYNENNGEVRFEGPLNFMQDDKNGVSIKAAGLGKGSFKSIEFDLNALMVFDFQLPVGAEIAMGEDIAGIVQRMGLPQANTDRVGLLYKLAEIVGEDAARAYEQSSLQDYRPLFQAGAALEKSLTFSGLKFKWSAEHNSWYSNGKLGLSNVGNIDANALIDGFVEIKHVKDEGNRINIFLQVSSGIWYYFSYEGNRLYTYSSYDEYNNAIDSKSKIGKAKPGEYVVTTSDIAETTKFVNRFRQDYFGIDTPYEFSAPQPAPAAATEDDPFGTSPASQPSDEPINDTDGF